MNVLSASDHKGRPYQELLRRLTHPASRVFTDPTSLAIYSFDQGQPPESLRKLLLPDSEPDIAVQPASLADLTGCIRFGLEKAIPMTPRGASTYGLGGAVPHHGGILLDFSARREIIEFDEEKATVTVSAGCRWDDVARFLHPKGFDLRTYPTSWFSTVGGWASTGGIGIGCSKYGNFHDSVRSLTVVTPTGTIETLRASEHPQLTHHLGTEGQMGAIWNISFTVRRKPATQMPFLILFDQLEDAIECASELLKHFHPYHLKFLDASRIHEINHLMRDEHPTLRKDLELAEKPTLLICFDSDEDHIAAFRKWTARESLLVLSDYRAHLLWRERMFPLRVKRIAPGLLASELIMPAAQIAAYVKKAQDLGNQFRVQLATECYFLNDGSALTLPVYSFAAQNRMDESLKAALAYVLTQTGIRMGGRPYGIGIWNSPFLKQKFGSALSALKEYKRKIDSGSLFNSGKFFDLRFRTGLAGKIAALPLQARLIPLWTALAPAFASLMCKPFEKTEEAGGTAVLRNEELCSKCGSCIPVCPAYVVTKDERTTARGKLQIGKRILQGAEITAQEANILFQCMHCAACTDVCQSRLDLVPVWDELERHVEVQFGKDQPRVEEFVKAVEEKKIMGVPYARGAEVLAGNQSES